MTDNTAELLKNRDIPLTDKERVSAYLANGMPNELIMAAASVEEYSWADVANLASQAHTFKARRDASEVARLNVLVQQSKSSDEGVTIAAELAKAEAQRVNSERQVGEFGIFARRLRGEQVISKDPAGNEIKLGPPSQDEMQQMFGRNALEIGKGKHSGNMRRG